MLGNRPLSLSRGGIGLRSLSDDLSACYIASLSMSSLCLEWISNHHLVHSIEKYNDRIPPTEAITIEAVSHTPSVKKTFPANLNIANLINYLLIHLCQTEHVHYLCLPSHAGAWLSVIPSPRLNLQLTLWNFKQPYSGG